MLHFIKIVGTIILCLNLLACNEYSSERISVKGLLYYGNDDAMTLVPCDGREIDINVVDSTNLLVKTYKDTLQYYYAGEAVYVELEGELQKQQTSPFKKDIPLPYTLVVSKIIQLTQRHNADVDCVYCDYSGGGNKPTWIFEVSEIGEYITLRDDTAKKSYYFDYTEPTEQGDTLIYKTQNLPMGNNIEIKINLLLEKGELSSEKSYPVAVLLNGKTLNGFAKSCY